MKSALIAAVGAIFLAMPAQAEEPNPYLSLDDQTLELMSVDAMISAQQVMGEVAGYIVGCNGDAGARAYSESRREGSRRSAAAVGDAHLTSRLINAYDGGFLTGTMASCSPEQYEALLAIFNSRRAHLGLLLEARNSR